MSSRWNYERRTFPSPLLCAGKQPAHACPGLGLPRFQLTQLPYAEQGIKGETKHTRGTRVCTHTHSSQHWGEETVPSAKKGLSSLESL